jgi:putative tryptophan/tyrosine transport system substrate-binding protein
MRRRDFITLLGGAAVSWPLAARAQQAAVPVIGMLANVSAAQWAERMAAFHRGLGEIGFVEGRNVAIEYRWSDGQSDKLPAQVDDLVRRKVAVLVVGGSDVAVRTAMSATKTIPIVFYTASDPVDAEFVPSTGRPGGNVTGVTGLAAETSGKRLDLLHELVPGVTKVALLVNPNNPRLTQDFIERSEAAAHRLGLDIVVFRAGTSDEIGSAIAAAAQQQVGAISIANDGYLGIRSQQIAFFALRHALPTIGGGGRQIAEAGLLMSYGSNAIDGFRFVGGYVGRILKGEKAANLPVLQPTTFELVINVTAAKALGLTVPPTLLAIADEVIE